MIRTKTQRGFTLVELLVVLAVIALLSSFVFAALTIARMKARDGRRIANARQLNSMVSAYESDMGTTTISGSGLGGVGYGSMGADDGTNPSIIRKLKNLGYTNSDNLYDPVYGNDDYYLGLCPNGAGTRVFAKLEQTKLSFSSQEISTSCGGTGALASGYNYVTGSGSGSGGLAATSSSVGGVPVTAVTMQGQAPSSREYHACTSISGIVYCFGGRNGAVKNDAFRYDVGNDAASPIGATLPSSDNLFDCDAGADGKVYCFGGHDGVAGLTSIVKYDPGSGVFSTQSAALPSMRDAHSCALAGGKIYCFGGYAGSYLSSITQYDPSTNAIATVGGSLPTGRYGHSCAAAGGMIYCFGGLTSGCGYTNDIISFDSSTGVVTTLAAKIPSPRANLSCASLSNGKIACAGGSDGNKLMSGVFVFDPAGGTITPSLAVLPSARDGLACSGGIAGDMYCVGGFDGTNMLRDILKVVP